MQPARTRSRNFVSRGVADDASVAAPVARRIEMRPVSTPRPFGRNARTHSKKQLRLIADSIQTFGFTNPVLIDESCAI